MLVGGESGYLREILRLLEEEGREAEENLRGSRTDLQGVKMGLERVRMIGLLMEGLRPIMGVVG